MGDADHRHTALRQVGDDVQHLAGRLRIEGAGRLVEQQNVGTLDYGARHRDALLFAAGPRLFV